MMSIIQDSHKLVEGLKKKGFSKAQAEGVKETFDQVDISHLATKKDLKKDLKLLRQELKTDMANIKSEIKTEMFRMMLAQTAVIVALIKLL